MGRLKNHKVLNGEKDLLEPFKPPLKSHGRFALSPDPDAANKIKIIPSNKLANYPFSAVFGIQIKVQSIWRTIGTCFAISETKLMTAAHVIDDMLKFSKNKTFRLTHNSGGHFVPRVIDMTFGSILTAHPLWNKSIPINNYDVGTINIPRAVFANPLAIKSYSLTEWRRLTIKFPWIYMVGGGRYLNSGRIVYGNYFSNFQTKSYPDLLFYTINTTKDMSGSPVFIYNNGKFEVSGMHTLGRSEFPRILKNSGLALSGLTLTQMNVRGNESIDGVS